MSVSYVIALGLSLPLVFVMSTGSQSRQQPGTRPKSGWQYPPPPKFQLENPSVVTFQGTVLSGGGCEVRVELSGSAPLYGRTTAINHDTCTIVVEIGVPPPDALRAIEQRSETQRGRALGQRPAVQGRPRVPPPPGSYRRHLYGFKAWWEDFVGIDMHSAETMMDFWQRLLRVVHLE